MADGTRNKVLLVVLCTLGGFMLLCVLPCAGLFYWGKGMFGELQAAQVSANRLLDDLQAGRVDAVYAAATPAFRASVTADRFRRLISDYPALTRHTRRTVAGMRVYQRPHDYQAVFQFNISDGSASLSVTLVLVKTGKHWRLERLDLPFRAATSGATGTPKHLLITFASNLLHVPQTVW